MVITGAAGGAKREPCVDVFGKKLALVETLGWGRAESREEGVLVDVMCASSRSFSCRVANMLAKLKCQLFGDFFFLLNKGLILYT